MTNTKNVSIELINKNMQHGQRIGVCHLSTSDYSLDGRKMTVNGQEVLNFGSCSYLGLEMDDRLKEASIEAIKCYGAQFSSSRSFMSLGLYDKLEGLMDQIFGKPTIVAPSTTMAHLACLPLLIDPKDVVILDHQVHASVQQAVRLAATNGAKVEMIRHSNMEMLENRIQKLKGEYNKIWYMADGIYSMYGDCAPVKQLERMLNEYEQFHLYIDDAHGMAWRGRNGSGYVLDQIDFHEKMYLSVSTSKGFASAGGVLIFPNQQSRDLVRNCGSTLIFSGPLQPSTLGAGIASAEIMLSKDIYSLQQDLNLRLMHFIAKAKALNLPLVGEDLTPIFYIGTSKVEVAIMLCKALIDGGYFTNPCSFPSVPFKNSGVRLTITRHLSLDDIDNFLYFLSKELDRLLLEHNFTRDQIFKAFKMGAYAG